mmetsp:Transcript_7291/g.9286  ORF Transcript_7291/g.9286 Transcript_7291/m.9286 type:complete len:84 (+) Transcript_7291:297-548(+)
MELTLLMIQLLQLTLNHDWARCIPSGRMVQHMKVGSFAIDAVLLFIMMSSIIRSIVQHQYSFPPSFMLNGRIFVHVPMCCSYH